MWNNNLLIAFGVTLGVLLGVTGLWGFVWLPTMAGTETAAWVQALGVISGVAVAIYVPWHQHQRDVRRDDEQRHRRYLARRAALPMTLGEIRLYAGQLAEYASQLPFTAVRRAATPARPELPAGVVAPLQGLVEDGPLEDTAMLVSLIDQLQRTRMRGELPGPVWAFQEPGVPRIQIWDRHRADAVILYALADVAGGAAGATWPVSENTLSQAAKRMGVPENGIKGLLRAYVDAPSITPT